MPTLNVLSRRKLIPEILILIGVCIAVYGIGDRGLKRGEVVVPQRVHTDGQFMSHNLSHFYSQTEVEGQPLNYKIKLDGRDRHIQLWPNRKMLFPGAVVETRTGERADSTALLKNVKVQRLVDNKLCYYRGVVKGLPDSTAALSTCNGLMGYVRLKRDTFLIEPMRKKMNEYGEHPHVVYKEKGGRRGPNHSKDRQRELNLETLLVIDKTMTDSHPPDQLENYVLSIFNIAYDLFSDANLDDKLNLELVRLIRLEHENDDMNLEVNKDMGKTLDAFTKWQESVNPIEDSHPYHHDVAALIAKAGPWKRSQSQSCGNVGAAKWGSACDRKLQSALALDTGLTTGYVLAHQIAHTLGVGHDTGTENGSCDPVLADGSSTLMNPEITSKVTEWSKCSKRTVSSFIEEKGACLRDEPAEHNFYLPQLLPGVLYGAEYQCRQLLGPQAKECMTGSTCDSLNCKVGDSECMKTGVPPAAGTNCGLKKWCFMEECVEEGAKLKKGGAEGSWSEWSKWSPCSRSCGSGVATAHRRCNTTRCPGTNKRHRICAAQPCQIGSPSFRDIQCATFNSLVFPEDNKTHTWKAIQIEGENPCELICLNENGVVAKLNSKVTDGTTCFRGIRDICIAGECKEIPCDFKLESNAVEDTCGVCHGNGAECKLVQGIKEYNTRGFHPIVMVPPGTMNIKVEEKGPTKAQLLIKSTNGSTIYNDGIKSNPGLGNCRTKPTIRNTIWSIEIYFNGSYGWLGMKKSQQEEVIIPGPVANELQIMVKTIDPVTVKYSMGIPGKQRKTFYSWDYADWSKCSAQCGPGNQYSNPKCTERIGGLVEDKFCKNKERPLTKTRACNLAPCTPRWIIGEWQDCGPCPSENSKHFRSVKCMIPIGERQEESEFVDELLCTGSKPISEEKCHCRNKRQFNYKIFSNQVKMNNDNIAQSEIFTHLMQSNPYNVSNLNIETLPTIKSEKKVTLMQLENESKESLSRQYKENEITKKIPFVIVNGQKYYPELYTSNEHSSVNKNPNLTNTIQLFKRNLMTGKYTNNIKFLKDRNDFRRGYKNTQKFHQRGLDYGSFNRNKDWGEKKCSSFIKLKNYKIGSSPLKPQLFNLFSSPDEKVIINPTNSEQTIMANSNHKILFYPTSQIQYSINPSTRQKITTKPKMPKLYESSQNHLLKGTEINNKNKVDLIINFLTFLVENQIKNGAKLSNNTKHRYFELMNKTLINRNKPSNYFPFYDKPKLIGKINYKYETHKKPCNADEKRSKGNNCKHELFQQSFNPLTTLDFNKGTKTIKEIKTTENMQSNIYSHRKVKEGQNRNNPFEKHTPKSYYLQLSSEKAYNSHMINKRDIIKKTIQALTNKDMKSNRQYDCLSNETNNNNNLHEKYQEHLNNLVHSIKTKIYQLFCYIKGDKQEKNNDKTENKTQSTPNTTPWCDLNNELERSTELLFTSTCQTDNATVFNANYQLLSSTKCGTINVTDNTEEAGDDDTITCNHQTAREREELNINIKKVNMLKNWQNHLSPIRKRSIVSILPFTINNPNNLSPRKIKNTIASNDDNHLNKEQFSKINQLPYKLLIPEIVLHPTNVELLKLTGRFKHNKIPVKNHYRSNSEQKPLKIYSYTGKLINDVINNQKPSICNNYEIVMNPKKQIRINSMNTARDTSKTKRNTVSQLKNKIYNSKLTAIISKKNKAQRFKLELGNNLSFEHYSHHMTHRDITQPTSTYKTLVFTERQVKNHDARIKKLNNELKLKQILNIAKKQRLRTIEQLTDSYMKQERLPRITENNN